MQDDLLEGRVKDFGQKHRRRRILRRVVSGLACGVVFCTTYVLILPAITMSRANPQLNAVETRAVLGEILTLEVTAQPNSKNEQTVFYLAVEQDNAGYALEFDDFGVAVVACQGGEEIELHREYADDGTVGYWFVLPYADEAAVLELPCVNGIGTLIPISPEETTAVPADIALMEDVPPVEEELPAEEDILPDVNPTAGNATFIEEESPIAEEPSIEDEALIEETSSAVEEPAAESEPLIEEDLPTVEAPSIGPHVEEDASTAEDTYIECNSPIEEQTTTEEVSSTADETPTKEEFSTETMSVDTMEETLICYSLPESNSDEALASVSESGEAESSESFDSEENEEFSQMEYEAGDPEAPGSLAVSAGSGATLEDARDAARSDTDGFVLCWVEDIPPVVDDIRTLTAVIHTDDTYQTLAADDTVITLTGCFPEGAEALAFPVEVETGLDILCAYDITIRLPDGSVFEPEENQTLTVSIQSSLLNDTGGAALAAYLLPQQGEMEQLETSVSDGGVTTSLPSESEFVLALGAAEKILMENEIPLASDETIAALTTDSADSFTYTDESTGFTATLTLKSSYYITADFDLVVARQDQAGYTNALDSFTTHGQTVEEAAIYKVYLVDKSSNQIHTNLGCAYTLEMSWPNGLFTQVDASDFLNFTYCKNSGSEPTELSNCQVTYSEDGNVTVLTATDSYYPNSAEFMFVRSSAPNGLTAGQYKLTFNEGKDTFLTDPAYSPYYNSNSPIGTAGSFHIVAFDSAYLNAHTNGNVLANNLYAEANFGTSNFANELSYIQNYKRVNGNSASSADHILVIGSENTVEFVDNGNAFSVNGTKIDKPCNLIQDKDTAAAPFIDLNRVKAEISQISGNLNGYEDANLTYTSAAVLSADHSKLELTTPSGVGVVNYTAAELDEKLGSYVQIDGFKTGSNGTVVINVNCTGATKIDMPQARIVIDGQLQNTSEVTEFSAGKVIWNFVNAGGVTINTHLMTGIILAPGATVNINQNLNGTVVADIININAESHRTDFTGKVIEPEEETKENEYYVTVRKIETGYAGSALPGAEFDLYKWENNDWVKVNTETLITGSSGTVMLHNLDASVAYKLVETKAPVGYVLKNGAFYFWVRTDKNQTQPDQRPSNFSGSMVEVGDTLFAANDKADVTVETTSLTVRKLWKTSDGTELTDITVKSITVEIYQIADDNTAKKTLYTKLTLNQENYWESVLNNLPLTGTDSSGNPISFTYTVEEAAVDGYQASYETDDGVVTITNKKAETSGGSYVLPETGGTGTTLYTIGGLLLLAGAGFLLLHNYRKRRKEDFTSS